MSHSARVNTDQSLLSRIDRFVFAGESFFNLIGGVVIFALVLLAVANILGRKLLNIPVNGYIDWVEQSMAFFAFLGLAYCHRGGGHIRMDMLISHLKGRALWVFEWFSTLLMLGISLAIIYGSWLHFLRAYNNGDSSFDINLPTWPSKLIVPLALSLLVIRLIIHLWAYTRAIITNTDNPIAVPLIEDAAAQAAREAEQVAAAIEQYESTQEGKAP